MTVPLRRPSIASLQAALDREADPEERARLRVLIERQRVHNRRRRELWRQRQEDPQ